MSISNKVKQLFSNPGSSQPKVVNSSGVVMPQIGEVDFNNPIGETTLRLFQTLSDEGVSLEDYIAGLIAIQMHAEELNWVDFWILVAKYASKVPLYLDTPAKE